MEVEQLFALLAWRGHASKCSLEEFLFFQGMALCNPFFSKLEPIQIQCLRFSHIEQTMLCKDLFSTIDITCLTSQTTPTCMLCGAKLIYQGLDVQV